MKLSLRSEYALLILLHLVRESDPAEAVLIASSQEIPLEMVIEILSVLNQAGYVTKVDTGFKITKPAVNISVVEIIRLFDGVLSPLEPVSSKGYEVAPMDREEKLTTLFEDIQAFILKRLEETSIADIS